jgi:hypothetical protein
MTTALSYQPTDEMSLWWLGQPEAPTLIGRLEFISTLRGVGLRYDANWLRHGFALSPAFDLLPTGQALGFQQMRVGAQGTESTLKNAISEHSLFGLTYDEAVAEIARVVRCVDGWEQHFKAMGVSSSDLQQLAAQIDRPFLLEQRRAW